MNEPSIISISLLGFFVIPLTLIASNLWSSKESIDFIFSNDDVSIVNIGVNMTIDNDLVITILKPEILIPLIIGSIFMFLFILLLFVFCNKERSNAITNIIMAIRGKSTSKETKKMKDIVVNVGNKASQMNSAPKSVAPKSSSSVAKSVPPVVSKSSSSVAPKSAPSVASKPPNSVAPKSAPPVASKPPNSVAKSEPPVVSKSFSSVAPKSAPPIASKPPNSVPSRA